MPAVLFLFGLTFYSDTAISADLFAALANGQADRR